MRALLEWERLEEWKTKVHKTVPVWAAIAQCTTAEPNHHTSLIRTCIHLSSFCLYIIVCCAHTNIVCVSIPPRTD